MDGDSLLDLLKVWFNLVLELVSLLAFSTLAHITTVFGKKVLSVLLCILRIVVFCLLHGGSEKMGEMHNNDPASTESTLRPWLCCKDLVSVKHIVLVGVTPLK